jgi:hypothetical protein
MSVSKCIRKEEQLQVVLEALVQTANQICQFSQRETKLNAVGFVQTLVLGWLRQTDASLNELAQSAQDLGISVTGSAIHERMGTAAVELLGRVLVGALRQVGSYPRLPIAALESFTAIHVTDSTQIGLPKALLLEFQGANQNAMLKVHVTIDYLTGQWVALEMQDATAPDQNSALPLKHAIAGSLNVFDLGYFNQERLRDIADQAAYFVSRYQSQTALYELETGARFNLVEWLKSLPVKEAECQVELGSRVQLPVRLVGRRLAQKVADARRRKASDKYKRDGKTCSETYLFLLGWDLLITNLPPAQWSLKHLFDLYPIRTQIEWLFRIWKSQMNVNHFGNWRVERVLCQLYAHLIGILLCQRLCAGYGWRDGREYSLFKCVQIIQDRIDDLMKCIARHWRGLTLWRRRLEAAFRQFGHKTKRKKTPSTSQILINWSLT